jgi:hypothetical protein
MYWLVVFDQGGWRDLGDYLLGHPINRPIQVISRLVQVMNDPISKPVKSFLGQGVRSLGLLMLGEGKFLPPKLPLLL